MKRIVPIAAMTCLLAGCACLDARVAKLDPQNPNVYVVDGRHLVVDQEPLHFGKERKNVTVVWRLPPDSGYAFPEKGGITFREIVKERDGIRFGDAGGEFPKCSSEEKGLKYSCLNVHSRPGTYMYAIRVVRGSEVLELDPTIVNY
jgi:hypothetical protein